MPGLRKEGESGAGSRRFRLGRQLSLNFDSVTSEPATELTYQAFEGALLSGASLANAELVRARRFGAVGDRLDKDAAASLRRWLNRGLVLAPEGAPVSSGESFEVIADHVAAIRTVSADVLGVPLVRLDSVARTLHLDWVPT